MKLTASLVITLVLVLMLSSCPTPMESKRGPSAVRKRHIVQKRLTAEDVLGDMHTQESGVLSESQCLDGECTNKVIILYYYYYANTKNSIHDRKFPLT